MDFLLEKVLPLIVAFLGGGMLTEWAKSRFARQERLELEDSKITEAEIAADQKRDEFLWQMNRKLIEIEQVSVREISELKEQNFRKDREVADLKRDLDEAMEEAALARRERANINTELTIVKAACETCQDELRRLKNLPPLLEREP